MSLTHAHTVTHPCTRTHESHTCTHGHTCAHSHTLCTHTYESHTCTCTSAHSHRVGGSLTTSPARGCERNPESVSQFRAGGLPGSSHLSLEGPTREPTQEQHRVRRGFRGQPGEVVTGASPLVREVSQSQARHLRAVSRVLCVEPGDRPPGVRGPLWAFGTHTGPPGAAHPDPAAPREAHPSSFCLSLFWKA